MWLLGLPFHLWGTAKGNVNSRNVWESPGQPGPTTQKKASDAWCLVFFVCLFLGGLWLLERALSAKVRNFLVFLFLMLALGF